MSALEPPTSPEREAKGGSKDYQVECAMGVLCGMLGILLSAAPHFWNWSLHGDWTYIADRDELECYLPVVARSYASPFQLKDPAIAEDAPNMVYPAIQFGPGIWIARQCELSPFGVSFVWRMLGGFAMGVSWFVLFRSLEWPRLMALAVAVAVLSDSGFLGGKPIILQALNAVRIASGHDEGLFRENQLLVPHWRIITPCLSLWALLLHLSVFAWARRTGTILSAAMCGVTVAALIYIYIYYWVAVGAALILGLALDTGHRRLYGIAGTIGLVGGLPYVIEKARLKAMYSTDWMLRTDMLVPAGNLPAVYSRFMLLALAVTLPIVWRYRREHLYVWFIATCGVLLANHHLLTGIELQNAHWSFVSGSISSTLILVLAAPPIREFASSRARRIAIGVLVVLHLATGLWFRVLDSSRPEDTAKIAPVYQMFREQRAAHPEALAAREGICGDPRYVVYAVVVDQLRPLDHYCVQFSGPTTNEEWDAQIALDAASQGTDRARFERDQEVRLVATWGPWTYDAALLKERMESRLRSFDRFCADPSSALRKYGVRYVALHIQADKPAYLNSGWRQIQNGPVWNVWERRDP